MEYATNIHECIVSPEAPRVLTHSGVPFRVLIDARKIYGGGIGIYINNLLSGLSLFDHISVTVLCFEDYSQFIKDNYPTINVIVVDIQLYSWREYLLLRRAVNFKKFDLFHTPHYTLPYFLPIPSVVTIHDIIHVTHPQKWYYPAIAKRLIRSAMRRAHQIVAVSNTTLEDLRRLYPRMAKKISVVPNAVGSYFFATITDRVALDIREREKTFCAVFSTLKPHKGFKDLIEAFTQLKKRGEEMEAGTSLKQLISEMKLVIGGQGTKEMPLDVSLHPDIRVLGELSVEDLQKLYAHSMALVVALLVEGFYIPAIEAQSCATPVIARPSRAVTELMTSNDYLCEDMSVEALTNGMYEFLSKCDEKKGNFELAVPLSHMRRFCRDTVTERLIEVYERALGLTSKSQESTVIEH